VLSCLGYFDWAALQRDAALDEARRLSDAPTLAWAVGGAAWLPGLFLHLEPGSLLQYADELLRLATEHGLLGFWRALALLARGWCLAALGRTDDGIPLVTAGLAGWGELGYVVSRPLVLTLLGDACRMAGQWKIALERFAEAWRLADKIGDRLYQAETIRLIGDLRLAMGDIAGAEVSYGEAFSIAQQQSAKVWQLCAAMSLARLWRDRGKRSEARDLLAPV
jgi:tetratricopeptide (TPR) repeat protein